MTDFDLRVIVRDVLDEGGCESFREYAVKVLGRIPPKQYKNALMATLTEFIRDQDHGDARPMVVPQRGEHASRKVAAIAAGWARFIQRHIATEQGTQIPLAEATEDQVRFYVGLLRVKAAEVAGTADRFEEIADLMAKEGAAKVRDLPAHLGKHAVRGMAA